LPTKIFNLGSLNLDRVLRVARLVRAGETVAAQASHTFAGGKGANQSVALARAGASVMHIGAVGHDGRWLVDLLAAEGVDTTPIDITAEASGEAIIQVDDAGENSIIIWPGANARISPEHIDRALDDAHPGDWLLAQNETSGVEHAMREARRRGLNVAINPAPFDRRAREYPFELAHLICVNEIEARGLTGEHSPDRILAALAARLPDCECVLTLGSAGAWYRHRDVELHAPAEPVAPVDTTAAGDTFLGYFLASRAAGQEPGTCLEIANSAAARCVTRAGAMTAIPYRQEIHPRTQ
jgi:ribokinase